MSPNRSGRLLFVAVLAVLAAIGLAAPAHAAPAPSTVQRVVIEDFGDLVHSILTLTFATPISAAQADGIRESFAGSASVSPTIAGDPMWCGSHISQGDSNGSFDIQYTCGSRRTLPWGYQLSAGLQSIIVSNVTERGMSFWRNGSFGGMNSPHVAPKDYTYHGNMSPVAAGERVDYSDYFTFRHNVGPGGTGSVTLAGTVTLMN